MADDRQGVNVQVELVGDETGGGFGMQAGDVSQAEVANVAQNLSSAAKGVNVFIDLSIPVFTSKLYHGTYNS